MELQEMIEDAKAQARNPVVLDLIEEFEAFSKKIQAAQALPMDASEMRAQFIEVMSESYDRLREKLKNVAASYGMSEEELHELLKNPLNLPLEDQLEVKRVQEMAKEELHVPKARPKVHKMRKGKV